ncbi:MAG: DUF177 domain-containing protein [Oscillospiraceae bacterium]|jgi:uncharacterized protein|nr:DUF177 domain-containing protein [Oscillospiraceae bacterium]
MRLNLCEIIDMPGESLSFRCLLDTERLIVPAIKRFVSPPSAEGFIRNSAGALTLTGEIKAALLCSCDRCLKEFHCDKRVPVEAKLGTDPSDADNPEIFPLDGDWLDLGDLLETSFILGTEPKFLCREDCAGLCPGCGKRLEDGPCDCEKEIDPRLAVLGRLLDKKD